MLFSILIFLIILSILVLIHEFGHFFAAKKSGVRVDEFGWGIPPRLWGKKIGETIYSINWLPFGGFVKVAGEDPDEPGAKKDPKSFSSKPVYARIIILSAGVVMNLFLGVFLYYVLLGTNNFQSEPLMLFKDYEFRFGSTETRVIAIGVAEDTPAEGAGIILGDIIEAYRYSEEETWVNVTEPLEIIDAVEGAYESGIYLSVENIRDGSSREVFVRPEFDKELERSIIGVNLAESIILTYQEPRQKLFVGFSHSYNVVAYSLSVLGDLFKSAFETRDVSTVSQTVAGPVGIYSIVDDIVQDSSIKVVRNLLDLTALLSLSLAIMNMLPIPALDGGRLIFVVWEGATGKPVPPVVEGTLHKIGFILLISLLILITLKDVVNLF